MKIQRLLRMIYHKLHYKMEGELLEVEEIMTSLKWLKSHKLTVVCLMMETSIIYKSTLALPAEKALVAEGRQQEDKVLGAATRTD